MVSPAPAVQSQCTICYNPFDNNERIPETIFPCGHTFCAQCIKQVSICPTDRAAFDRTAPNWGLISSLPASALAAQVKATSPSACSAAAPAVAVVPKNPSPEEGQPAPTQPSAQFRFDQAMKCAPFNRADAASLLEQVIRMPDAEDNMRIKAMARHYLAEFLDSKEQRIQVLLEQVIRDPHALPEHQAADRYTLAKLYMQREGKAVYARFLYEHISSDPHAAGKTVAHACCALAKMYLEGDGGLSKSDQQAGVYYARVLDNPNAADCMRAEAHTYIGLFHVHGKGGYVQSDELAKGHFEQVKQMCANCNSIPSLCLHYVYYWMGVFYREGRGGCEISEERAYKHFERASSERSLWDDKFEFTDEADGWAALLAKGGDKIRFYPLGYYLTTNISEKLRTEILNKKQQQSRKSGCSIQ